MVHRPAPFRPYAAQQPWHSHQRSRVALYMQFINKVAHSPKRSTTGVWQDHVTSCTNNCKKFKKLWLRKDLLTSNLFGTFHENLKSLQKSRFDIKTCYLCSRLFSSTDIVATTQTSPFAQGKHHEQNASPTTKRNYPATIALCVLSLATGAQINTSKPRNRRDLFCSC